MSHTSVNTPLFRFLHWLSSGVAKKSGLMSKTEAAIGARIKEFRERIEWPQSVFAYEVGITRDKLASIEYGRTPLRYDVALRVCKRYRISQLWLAKGVGSPQADLELEKSVAVPIPSKTLFSKAFTVFLEPLISERLLAFLKLDEATGAEQSIIPPTNVPPGRHHEWYAAKAFRTAVESVPADTRAAFCDAVLETINSLSAVYSSNPKGQLPLYASAARFNDLSKGKAKNAPPWKTSSLTDSATSPSFTEVKAQLPSLLERLKKATAQKGKKSELAEYLQRVTKENVPLASVSRWLSGEREPGGEIALQMDAWATAQGFPKGK